MTRIVALQILAAVACFHFGLAFRETGFDIAAIAADGHLTKDSQGQGKGRGPPPPPSAGRGPPPPGSGPPSAARGKGPAIPGFEVLVSHLKLAGWKKSKLEKKLSSLSQGGTPKCNAFKALQAIEDISPDFDQKVSELQVALAADKGSSIIGDAVEYKLRSHKKNAVKVDVHMKETKASESLRLKDFVTDNHFQPNETLFAFDFDLTVKAPMWKDGAVGFEIRGDLRTDLEDLYGLGVETVIVTATAPNDRQTNGYQAVVTDVDKVAAGKFFLERKPRPPEGIEKQDTVKCLNPSCTAKGDSEEYKTTDVWIGRYTAVGGAEGGFFQAGRGIILSRYLKAQAIEHYIYYYGMRGRIKHIVFMDDAVSNVETVAEHFYKTQSTSDAVFEAATIKEDCARLDASEPALERPADSVLERVDAIWWSTEGLKFNNYTSGDQYAYDWKNSGGDDNSYQETEDYRRYRASVRDDKLPV
eukprot:gnl/TRDRNA2_/TRDRNA2_133400_c0_seq1.p1 gnl/TRDRNA2_/TRDRNA2_133400_c0~~gnl/TRDRNA2_/TRDRNA2_133400_c0_seq1.p1  ORF type:complete len:495 (-),score=95.09 gnl/TRDRNA2_/TRDRNA2_133400_c0_seq1:56-1471(-)